MAELKLTKAQQDDLDVKSWLFEQCDFYNKDKIIKHFEEATENRLEFAYIYQTRANWTKTATKKEITTAFNPVQSKGIHILNESKEKNLFLSSPNSIAFLFKELAEKQVKSSRLRVKEVSEYVNEAFEKLSARYLAVVQLHFN